MTRARRRSWFAAFAVGVASWLACGSPTPPAPLPPKPADVIIVGAGLAGLTAAKQLIKAGRTVLVLEAQDHIGGRAATDTKTFSVPIDLGAAWFHGVKTNPLPAVADGMGFHRVASELEGPIFIGDRRATAAETKACEATTEKFEAALKALTDANKDPAISEVLPKNAPCRDLVGDNFARFESAAELEDTSTIDTALFGTDPDDLLKEGMGTFVAAYGKDVPVRLNSMVTKVAHVGQDVVVDLATGEHVTGRRVLITVSTGVLAAGKIAFAPPLPQWKLDAIKALPMGVMDKVVMEFKSNVFTRTPDNAWVLWDGPGRDNIAFVIKPFGAPIAVAFYGAKQAVEFEKDDAKALEHAKNALRKMYGPSVESEFLRSAVTHWAQNPYTLGSYSAALPNGSRMHAELFKPIDNWLFFAGEAASSPLFNGSLAGAYQTAVDASQLIANSLAATAN